MTTTRSFWRPLVKSTIAAVLVFESVSFSNEAHSWTHQAFPRTYLIDIQQASELSQKIRTLQGGGYESAQGTWISYRPWYQRNHGWSDTSIAFITEVTPNWGVIWGAGTGERGSKYIISPSVKIGFTFNTQINKSSHFSIEGTTTLGGRLKEKSCVADYGEIGGREEVNCRLAASMLEPGKTLQYLFDEKPRMRHRLFIRYTSSF